MKTMTIGLMLILAFALLALGGCTPQSITDAQAGVESAKVALADATAAVTVLEAKRAEVAATIETLPEADRPAAMALLAKYDETLAKVKNARDFADKRIAELEKAMAGADDWVDVALGVINEGGGDFGIYGVLAAGIAGAGLGWWKAYKKSQAGVAAIQGIQAGKDEKGDILLSDPLVAAKVAKAQGDAGNALVNQITKPLAPVAM